MAMPEFKYPSEWTESFEAYEKNRDELIKRINNYMKHYDTYVPAIKKQTRKLSEEFFSAKGLLDNLG
jgi:hypothetical protein